MVLLSLSILSFRTDTEAYYILNVIVKQWWLLEMKMCDKNCKPNLVTEAEKKDQL